LDVVNDRDLPRQRETGLAFNVEHGGEVAGKLHTGDGKLYRTMRAKEQIPPMFDSIGSPFPVADRGRAEAGPMADGAGVVYWTRFENLLGERFEVCNYPDPTRPAESRPRSLGAFRRRYPLRLTGGHSH
jgi:hypothetical protein